MFFALAANLLIPATKNIFLLGMVSKINKVLQTQCLVTVWNRFQTLPNVSKRITNDSKRLFSWGSVIGFVILLYGAGQVWPRKKNEFQGQLGSNLPDFNHSNLHKAIVASHSKKSQTKMQAKHESMPDLAP
jgi:hypothetical protein